MIKHQTASNLRKKAFKIDPSLRGCSPLCVVKGRGQHQVCEVAGYSVSNKVQHSSKTVIPACNQVFKLHEPGHGGGGGGGGYPHSNNTDRTVYKCKNKGPK